MYPVHTVHIWRGKKAGGSGGGPFQSWKWGHFNFQGAEKKVARLLEESPYRGIILEHKF